MALARRELRPGVDVNDDDDGNIIIDGQRPADVSEVVTSWQSNHDVTAATL
jgi:hypothetical protein